MERHARPVRIAVAGCGGRMGRMLVRAVLESPRARLVGASVRPGSPMVGLDLARALGTAAPEGLTVQGDIARATENADALLDFTTPEASLAHAQEAAERGFAHVIGTTGFSEDALRRIGEAAGRAVIVRAGNMSPGVTLLEILIERAARVLDESYEIEILDIHHGAKRDAPSGTALMFGEAAARGRGVTLGEARISGRDGILAVRPKGSIGFAALRGGSVVGEHDVMFAGAGERLHFRHVASDRMLFARGALKAAFWAQGRNPGDYSMRDVLEVDYAP